MNERRNWKDGDESGSEREVLQRSTYRIKRGHTRLYVGFVPTRACIVMVINTVLELHTLSIL